MEVNVKNSNNIISKVYKGSIAEEIGIEVGDLLIAVNDEEIHDIIEYKFLISDEYIELEIQKRDGEVYIYEIEKDFDEELGIEFVNPIIDKAKSCRNKCVFCFIDQLPKGMRETLYFKDDDSRLSFLQGNFVTLTNMSEEDIDNIIKYRISPINISVHTTNPELRRKMITNKHAGKLIDTMNRLADAHIEMNCQIVLCPGYNDKEELDRTLNDLSSLYPYVNSVAIVPVGITKYRDNLAKLDIFTYESANETIDQVHALQEKYLKDSKFLHYISTHLALKLASLSVSNSVNILYPLENRLASYILASYTNEDSNNTENLTQIAEFLGTSYRHLLRVVKEFELEKIIKRDNKKLVILDKDKLEDLAGDLYQ